MKILSCDVSGGDVCATILCEAEDKERFGGPREAIEGCIGLFEAEKGLGALALKRVTRMDERPGGATEFDFDAAVPPKVDLDQYQGLEVYVPSDETPDLSVLRAAAEHLHAEIPETYISRKTDGLIAQRREDVAQRTGFTTLADMLAILRGANAALGLGRTDGELWDAAVAAADEMSGAQLRAHSSAETIAILASALFGEGEGDRDGAIARALRQRAEEKPRMSPESLAQESFACYLRLAGKTEQTLREDFRDEATELVRFDLLIDEVARREHLDVSDEEFNAALELIAGVYDMHPAEILQQVDASALRDRLVRDKARAMIIDSARMI
ncbi:MAG: hypothetical protein IJP64_07250 [Oscillospiraceae bacterium]|nr:hypothetical protein [Oscillospiraceae bacterium]